MSDQKGIGSKILGIFVQNDEAAEAAVEEGGEKTAAERVQELASKAGAGPEAGAPPSLRLGSLAAPVAGAPIDFEAIFREAGMDLAELDRVKKAEDLLKSLPEATPQPVKKQIVEASLKAFGFEVEKIILAAENQKRALGAYVKVNENVTAQAIQDAEAQIRSFNDKIAALRADIEKRTAALTALSGAAELRKGQVQKVLEFFQVPTPTLSESRHT